MKLLLDTHALLWWAHEPDRLSAQVFDLIGDSGNNVLVSAVSAMEIATKNRFARVGYPTPLGTHFAEQTAAMGFTELSITAAHALLAGGHAFEHRDPWDRLLAAQSVLEQAVLVTKDREIAGFGIDTLW